MLSAAVVADKKQYLFDFVSPDRAEKAKKYVKEEDRLLSLGGAYLIKKYVGDVTVDERGKPRSENHFFNISHSVDLVGIAISDKRDIGLDIEKDREIKGGVDKYCLSADEFEACENGLCFLSAFVAKESLAKADGRGIVGDIKAIPALPLDGPIEYGGKCFYRHTFKMEGYRISVALEGEDFKIDAKTILEIQP